VLLAVLYRCMLNSTICFSFFCIFVCVPVFYVCSVLSVNFLLCSMGHVA